MSLDEQSAVSNQVVRYQEIRSAMKVTYYTWKR